MPTSPITKGDPKKGKKNGRVALEWLGFIFPDVKTWDGFIMEGVKEVSYAQLTDTFFSEGQSYHLIKDKYMQATRRPLL